MDPRPPLVEESDLHAFVDDELAPERRRQIEDHLLLHREDAALIENWRRQNAAMRAAFDEVARETPPLSLRNAAARNARAAPAAIESGAIHWGRPGGSLLSARRSDSGRGGPRRNAWLAAATSLVAGAAIAVAAIALLPRFPSAPGAAPSSPLLAQGYVDRADVAYQTFARALNPVEFGAEQKDELSSALAARVGFAPAPDLASTGLRLLGGRLTPGLRGPAGLLIYENATGARVALYFERAEAGPIPFVAPRVEQGLLAAEWRAAGMAFVLIGPLEANAMQRAAERAAADILARAAGETPKP